MCFTISSEDMNVKLLKQVHDESVNLRKQPNEEDDGKAQGENWREREKEREIMESWST